MSKYNCIVCLGVASLFCLGSASTCINVPGPSPLAFLNAKKKFVNWESPHVSPIDLAPGGALLLAVNTAAGRLEMFDLTGDSPRWIAATPVGIDPVSVRARTNSEAWVVNHVSDSISVVDVPTRRVTRTILTHDEPTDVVFAGGRAFVTCSQANEVLVFDLANLDAEPVVLPIAGEDPRALAVSPDGSKIYAAIFESGNCTTLVGEKGVSDKRGPYAGVNPPPNRGDQFVPPMREDLPKPPRVSLIVKKDLATGRWLDDNLTDWSSFITWDLHDHDVAVIDAATLDVGYIPHLMNLDMALGVRPDGQLVVVGTDATNHLRFEPNLTAHFVHSVMAIVDPANPAGARVFDLNPHLAAAYAAGATSVAPELRARSLADPRGVAWRADGAAGYVAGMGSNNVAVIDAQGARLTEIEVGQGPTGLRIDEVRRRLYVMNKFDATISVVDLTANRELSRVAFFDPTPQEIRNGRPFLYDARLTSGLGVTACGSCHIDGRMDQLAWDLGNPAGEVKPFNQECNNPLDAQRPPRCGDFHPMKGPMTTQTLQGIIGVEPLHWRADREDLAAFNPAFQSLLGSDRQLTPDEMARFEAFIATITYGPNPNRNIDNSLRLRLGDGRPPVGEFIFKNQFIDTGANAGAGLTTCVKCHVLPEGTNREVTNARQLTEPQGFKVPQLRNVYEKTGLSKESKNSNSGFGLVHDGSFDSVVSFLHFPVFAFPDGPQGDQDRRDLRAFVLSLSTDTHVGVGQQMTLTGANRDDRTASDRIERFESIAERGDVGLIVKGVIDGAARGLVYIGGGLYQADRPGEIIKSADLRSRAADGGELTWTIVPAGSESRLGIDANEDGALDSSP